MNYYDARKQATPGPLHVDACGFLSNLRLTRAAASWVETTPIQDGGDPAKESEINAALLAHCFNKFDELLKGFKLAVSRLPETAPMQDYADTLIASCEEVEI